MCTVGAFVYVITGITFIYAHALRDQILARVTGL